MYMSHGNLGCSLALISLAVGYIVLIKAAKETKALKVLGVIIGAIIIASTLLMGIGKVFYCAKYGQGAMMGPKTTMDNSPFCPIVPGAKK